LRTIGFLGPPPSAGGLVQAFQQSLRDLGYIEGKNIRIEYRYTDVALQGRAELFPQFAAELVQLKPDVLVVSVTEAALAAKNATSTIPIVMVSVPDPVAAGLVASLARPGGNVTGLSRQTRDIISKTMQLLKEAVRETIRVNLLSDPKDPLSSRMVGDPRKLRSYSAYSSRLSRLGRRQNSKAPSRPSTRTEPALCSWSVERAST
jgi:ABC-type uncharacterized transport system substrate-binding protein